MTRFLVAAVAVSVLALQGCAQGTSRVWKGDLAHPATRAELYARFGPPEAILRDGDDRILRYDHSRTKGMHVGASYWGIKLEIARRHRVADRVWVRVDSNDRVTEVTAAPYDQDFGYRLWPFGD